jgi:hypothetical protein
LKGGSIAANEEDWHHKLIMGTGEHSTMSLLSLLVCVASSNWTTVTIHGDTQSYLYPVMDGGNTYIVIFIYNQWLGFSKRRAFYSKDQ